jgi:hypothetical protein
MDLGPYLGAKIFDRLNLEGYSDESQLVSLRKLKAIANAIGHKNPNFVADTDELLQQPCIIRVGMGKGDFADRNEVKGYMSIKDNAPKSDTASKATATPTKPAQVAQRPPVQKTEPKPANRSTPPPITKKPSAPLETLQNEDGRRTPFERPVVEEVVSDVNADDLIEEIKDKDPEF